MNGDNHWKSETIYLENVSGHKIVEEQNKINEAPDKFVVATQVFLIPAPDGVRKVRVKKIKTDEEGREQEIYLEHTAYDAFIYYKQKPTIEDKVVETNPKMDIILPD